MKKQRLEYFQSIETNAMLRIVMRSSDFGGKLGTPTPAYRIVLNTVPAKNFVPWILWSLLSIDHESLEWNNLIIGPRFFLLDYISISEISKCGN